MNTLPAVVVVAAYVILLTYVAIRARAATKFDEFSLAGRQLPLALVFGSLAATYVGPVFSIGFVEKGFESGLLYWFIGLAYALQNILVGLLIAPRLRALTDCHTLGDVMGQKYNRTCHILTGVVSVGLCAGFAAVMAKAGGDVLKDTFSLPLRSSVIIVAGVTALYTTFGGLRASVATDAFQFSAFAIFLPIILLVVLPARSEEAPSLARDISTATAEGFGQVGTLEIIGLLAAFFLGEMLIPPYANRALASRTTRISRNGFILAGLFSILWFMVVIILGIAARGTLAESTDKSQVLLDLAKTVMPRYGYALLLVVLISVIMSSLDSLLNAGAVAFTRDIARNVSRFSDNTALNIGRVATVGIAATAAVAAVAVDDIVSGLLICYTIWAPAILPALIAGLWIRHPNPWAAIFSMTVGTIVSVLLELVFPEAVSIPAIIPALTASLLAYAAGHFLLPSTGNPPCRQPS